MRIKSIGLSGFKSFYDKTVVQFHNDTSAIVGPNGCGKSNILDAIRWILGEQNPRRLRADGMDEVISNGSEILKPLGMAEVSLVMEAQENGGFEEVEIKRRLFRSGDSEYYINGVNCRLKDITEMFLDTGAGARAYSIIGQGRVEFLITAKPEEKRTLIEEVAGIGRYKLRKRETESRIRSTEDNLSRVTDMANEVKHHMDTLSRQAENADKFKRISEEAKKLEYFILSAELLELNENINRISAEQTSLSTAIAESESNIHDKDQLIRDMNSLIEVSDKAVEELESDVYTTKTNLQSKESMQEIARNEIANIDIYIERIKKDIESLTQEKNLTLSTISNNESRLGELKTRLDSKLNEIRSKQDELSAHRSGSQKIKTDLDNTKSELYLTLDEINSFRDTMVGFEKELSELISRKNILTEELTQHQSEKKEISGKLTELDNTMSDIAGRKKVIEETNQQLGEQIESYRTKLTVNENEQSELTKNLNETKSRLDALRQIHANYEWLPQKMKEFVVDSKGNGIIGLVSDFIKAKTGYETAVESALSDKLSWIVLRDQSHVKESIESLHNNNVGRGTFYTSTPTNKQGRNNAAEAGLAPLSNYIDAEGLERDLIEALTQNIYVVESLDDGLRCHNDQSIHATLVTPKGDIIHPEGAVTGGPPARGVLTIKGEIDELSALVSSIDANLSAKTKKIEDIRNEIDNLSSRFKSEETKLIDIGIKEAENNKDMLNTRSLLNRIEERCSAIEDEIARIDEDTRGRELKINEMNTTAANYDQKRTQIQQNLSLFEEQFSNVEEVEKKIEAEISAHYISKASLDEQIKNMEKDIVELNSRSDQIEIKLKFETKEIEEKNQNKLDLQQKNIDAKSQINLLVENLETKEQELADKKTDRLKNNEQLKTYLSEKEELMQKLSETHDKHNSLSMDLNRLEIEKEHIKEIFRKNDIDENTIYSKEDGETPEIQPEPIDIESSKIKLQRLQARIERFGPVNLLAPEEFKKLEERHIFLTEQIEDLTSAISSLRTAIKKIDSESEKRFKETFDQMNEKFTDIFNRLFRGGEGKLVLTDPDNMLESGVDVVVRPSGKRFQSINLLSGGEKALSAIALVLSACCIKPAPFLLFDEIDAPLDDRNTTHFIDLLTEMTDSSQVIMITHNKKTMQSVNSLIGITSNNKGTSKVVSVELN